MPICPICNAGDFDLSPGKRAKCPMCDYWCMADAAGKMRKTPGAMTRRVADELQEEIGHSYRLVCDIGDRRSSRYELRQTQAYFDKSGKLGNHNRLAEVDFVISRIPQSVNGSPRALCLIEIEESTATPKHLLGDALALHFTKAVTIKGEAKETLLDETTPRLVAAWVMNKGSKLAQCRGLARHINEWDQNIHLIVEGADSHREGLDNLRQAVLRWVRRLTNP